MSDELQNQIQDRAYYKWLDAGQPLGRDGYFWEEARLEIEEEMAKKPKGKIITASAVARPHKNLAAILEAAAKKLTSQVTKPAQVIAEQIAQVGDQPKPAAPVKELSSKDKLQAASIQAQRMIDEKQVYREVHRSPNMHVIEFEPQVRVCKMVRHEQKELYWLAMPYMQFTRILGKNYSSLHVSFSNKPIETINDTVYFPPLPNIWYPSGQCCLMHCPNNTLKGMMTYFWNTSYLDCEDWYCYPVMEKMVFRGSYKQWEKMTKADPKFILGVEWSHPMVIAEIPSGKFSNQAALHTSKTNSQLGVRMFAVVPSNNPLD